VAHRIHGNCAITPVRRPGVADRNARDLLAKSNPAKFSSLLERDMLTFELA
jgi:hypothetical protein